MGFVSPGIPSKPSHISRLKRSYKLGQSVYYDPVSKHKKAKHHHHHRHHHHKYARATNLEMLPVEVLRRIFAYTGGYAPMTLLSRQLYESLRPGNNLLRQIFWERYTWSEIDPIDIGVLEVDGLLWNTKQVLVNSKVFNNPLMCNFLLTHYNNDLELSIAYFVEDSDAVECLDTNGLLDPLEIKKMNARFALRHRFINDPSSVIETPYNVETEKEQRYRVDFPAVFYHTLDLLFNLPQSTWTKLRKHFYMKRPYDVMTSLIPWFFQQQEHDPHRLIDAVQLVLRLSNNDIAVPDSNVTMTSTLPLTFLISELYTFGNSQDALEFITTFISTFYQHDNGQLLSEPELWAHLKEINNRDLTSLIIKLGGQPDLSYFT